MVMDAGDTKQLLMHSHFILVANSILIYDHMVTLPEEIAFIWCRPKSLSAMLFLLNRYVALLCNLCIFFIGFLPESDKSCSKYELFRKLFFFTQAFIVCLIMTIRTYALYGCNKCLLTWMILIMVTLMAGASVATFRHSSSTVIVWSGGSCDETYTAARAIRLGMAWVALFLFDLLIFILTVYKTCKTRGLLRLSLVTRRNVVDIIFHDGVMYFGAMTLINLPNIATYYWGSDITKGNLTTFTSCISGTLISRLMLNLHKYVDTGILPTPAQDEDHSLAVLTTRVDVQSAISSHHW